MLGETLNERPPQSTAPQTRVLAKHLLYSIFARIGGSGLDTDAFETLRASHRGGFLGRAIAYDNRQSEIPAALIQSLRWHPVRLLSSFVERSHYYGAKKKYLDWIASRQLATGRYDLFHSWSGDCLQSLRVACKRGIPSLVEIPTWHRDWAKVETRTPGPKWKDALLLERERYIEEYDLASLLIVLSEKAAETFRAGGQFLKVAGRMMKAFGLVNLLLYQLKRLLIIHPSHAIGFNGLLSIDFGFLRMHH